MGPTGGDPALEVRAFAASVGVAEDPVTGSLQASAAQWLIDAGAAAGRATSPPRAAASAGTAGSWSSRSDGEVWVGGATDIVIEGTIEL